MWIYGSGFPKSHNVGKSIDKMQGNQRQVVADFRRDGGLQSFSSDLINQFKNNGMLHWDTIIMENISPFASMQLYKANCKRYTSKIHEYILVFRKPGEYVVPDYCSVDIPQQTQKLNQFFI